MRKFTTGCAVALCAALLVFRSTTVQAIEIDIRLACEVTGGCRAGDFFVDHPEALVTLRFAASAYEPFTDDLVAVTVYSPTFENPNTGSGSVGIASLPVAEDTLIVYAGARDLPDSRVAEAGPGDSLFGADRNQGLVSGPNATDFATWGGSIAFDSMPLGSDASKWHFGVDTPPGIGKIDFLSVALHELGHVLGFGTAPSFDNLVVNHEFQGAKTTELYGSAVPTFASGGFADQHWADGVTSPPAADEPRVSFGRALVLGNRTLLSPLDYAALDDLGWEVPAALTGLHGDWDGNQRVDAGDFLAWQRGAALAGPDSEYALWLWKQHFGEIASSAAAFSEVTVPEPSTALLLSLSLAVGLTQRCRRGR